MGYRATVKRTVVGKELVLPADVVDRDGKQYLYASDAEVEDAEVERHVTLMLGDTVLAEEWDFRRGLTFGECEEIEKLYGQPMARFEELVDQSALARKVLIHVLLKRTNPSARLQDLDSVSRGDWHVEVRDEDVPPVDLGPTARPSAPEPSSVPVPQPLEPVTTDSSETDG